jgi:hypothetical protein
LETGKRGYGVILLGMDMGWDGIGFLFEIPCELRLGYLLYATIVVNVSIAGCNVGHAREEKGRANRKPLSRLKYTGHM